VIVIGAVFLVLAALAAVAAVVMGRDVTVHLHGFGVDVTTDVLWVFCAGAVAMLLLVIALSAFRRAARKRRNQRRELKALRAEEAAAAETRAAQGGREVDASSDGSPSGSAAAPSHAVDVRETEGAHAYRRDGDDPGPERRYVPGEERVN
jgi:membrane protein implicated in regulation of membrane protease activity